MQSTLFEKKKGYVRLNIVKGEGSEWVDKWISERHYLGNTPAGARVRMAFYDKKVKLIGCMFWGRPVSRMLNQKKMLELTRMYFVDDTPTNIESFALAKARKWIRRNMPLVKGVIAYSSTAQEHEGTIYKADNWFKVGKNLGGDWSRLKRPCNTKDKSPKVIWVRSP
jgi:hypothetical protein